MKILIQKIERQFTNKEGNQLISKTGKPYSFVKVHSGGKIYSTFGGRWNDEWKEGEVIDVEIEQKGAYLNILPPKKAEEKAQADANTQILEGINNKLDEILEYVRGGQ